MTRVLLIEDDDGIRGAYASNLDSQGYEVVVAEDAESAKREIEKGGFEIVISDTELGQGQWGDKICREELRGGRLKDVMIIGVAGEHDADEKWKRVAHDFLYKNGTTDIGAAINDRYERFRRGELKRLGED